MPSPWPEYISRCSSEHLATVALTLANGFFQVVEEGVRHLNTLSPVDHRDLDLEAVIVGIEQDSQGRLPRLEEPQTILEGAHGLVLADVDLEILGRNGGHGGGRVGVGEVGGLLSRLSAVLGGM